MGDSPFLEGPYVENELSEPFDVCIVGGGPTGIATALALNGRGLRILLVEGGSLRTTLAAQEILRAEQSGAPYWRLDNSRYAAIGGSANRWGGICRPLDAIDLEKKSWVALSGWPLTNDDLIDVTARSAEFLGIGGADFGSPSAEDPWAVPTTTDSEFEGLHYGASPYLEFGERFIAKLAAASDVTVVTDLHVTELVTSPSEDLVTSVKLSTTTGRNFTVRAGVTVLAAGTVENARLLLMSRGSRAAGLGNEHDVVGRYFMEHFHAEMGHLVCTPASQNWTSYDVSNPARPQLRSAIMPSAATQRENELLTATIAVGPPDYQPSPPYNSKLSGVFIRGERAYLALEARGGLGGKVAHAGVQGARLAWRRVSSAQLRRRLKKLNLAPEGDGFGIKSLYVRSEQVPLASNRVTLASTNDVLGRPMVHLNWEVDDYSARNAEVVMRRFAAYSQRNGLGRVVGPHSDWRSLIVGGPHQLGTTRMSASPRQGVVDKHGQVHSIPNLFVAGASTFATGGHANPTVSAVALSLRTAEEVFKRAMAMRPKADVG